MGFFSRFLRRSEPMSKIDGLLGYYGLGEWWLTTFREAERNDIEARYQPIGLRPGSNPLTRGHVGSTSQTAVDFLSGLASWFPKVDDTSIAQRIRAKIDELSQAHPVYGPGYYRGRHYTTYVEEVKALKRGGDSEAVERLLLVLVDATEAENKAKRWGVAPWYYEELAKLYRVRKDFAAEVGILERFKRQRHSPGVKPQKLLERLEKAQRLLATQHGLDS